MPNLLATASQVANSLSNLKAKYIKYLESLCAANGIDIATLKTEGETYELLERFFGGLPVLVGLRYFSNLSVLRVFGQQITCVKPLIEVSATLTELWICEGSLKELAGIENCVGLRKLYLYENEIESALALTSLRGLQVLDLASNNLKSLEFLCDMRDLTSLNLSDNKMRDGVMMTAFWPKSLQQLDISGNNLSSFKAIFPIFALPSLRNLNLFSLAYSPSCLQPTSSLLYSISYSLRYVEHLNDDIVTEAFSAHYKPLAEVKIASAMNELLKLEEKSLKDVKQMDKMCSKVEGKLYGLSEALSRYRDGMSTKDVKKEVVKRFHELCSNNAKAVKKLKKNFAALVEYKQEISRYKIANSLESGGSLLLKEGTSDEVATLTQFLNFNCSMKHSYELHIRASLVLRDFVKSDVEKFHILEKQTNDRMFDVISIIDLLDHLTDESYKHASAKLVRDFEIIKKQSKEKTLLFFIPIVLWKGSSNRVARVHSASAPEDEDAANIVTPSDQTTAWADIRFVAILAVEMQPLGQLTMMQIRHQDQFEKSWSDQLKILNDMNIKLDIREERMQKTVEVTEASVNATGNKASKVKKVSDVIEKKEYERRWGSAQVTANMFTIRTFLEIVLAYYRPVPCHDTVDIFMRMTTLDLSELKLTKLAGIQGMPSLQHLSLRKNKLTSIKVEILPRSLTHLDVTSNKLIALHFDCLENLKSLKAGRNLIKSMKGFENCRDLEVLYLNDNHIKDKLDLDLLRNFPKLWFLELSNNPVIAFEGYRAKVLSLSFSLISLDGVLVPLEERSTAGKQTSRGFSIEFIERLYPDWKNRAEMRFEDQKIELIMIEKAQKPLLNHVKTISFSRNKLSSLKELSALELTHLEVASNCVKVVANPDNSRTEVLNLSGNSIGNANLTKLGLQYLTALKELNLAGNQISKFEATIFDLPNLESLDLSDNAIKMITKRTLKSLTFLSLKNNRLTTLNGLQTPCLRELDVSHNKLASCASLKPICEMEYLHTLDCRENVVTERRVYVEFIKSNVTSVTHLDGEPISNSEKKEVKIKKESSMPLTSFDKSWAEKEFLFEQSTMETYTPLPLFQQSRLAQRRSIPISHMDDFSVTGTKMVQHRKT